MTHPATSPPHLTALLPVKAYHERFLREAVDSMRAQTSPQWRLLVVAAPSVRARLEDLLAAPLADPRISLIAGSDRAIGAQFNIGMKRAGTGWVAILLGDDLWAPEAVEVLARAIEKSPSADFLHSARRFVDEHGRSISSVYPSRAAIAPEDFVHSSPVKHLLCWRREKALAIGGMDEALTGFGVDDFDFPWSMHDHGAVFQAVPECLYVARDHRESFRLTTHLTRKVQRRELVRIMRKHGADEAAVATRLAIAEDVVLNQALYRSRIDRWRKALRGHDPRDGWREEFR